MDIRYPEDGEIRARTVVSRSRARATGKYPSWKMGRMIQWESENELNAFRLLDAQPDVKRFNEQPMRIRYRMNGEIHDHYPDVLVEFATAKHLWEIKPLNQARRPEVMERTRILQASLARWNYTYEVVLAEQLAMQPRLSIALRLLRFGRAPVSNLERERIRRILESVPFVSWSNATSGELGPGGRAVLCRLVLEGHIRCGWDEPIGPLTRFTWHSGPQP